MRRILTLAALAAVVLWGGCRLWRGLQPDETKIRWLLEDAVAGFNDARPRAAVAPLAEEWRDRTTGVRREELLDALRYLAFQERGRKAGELPWVLELPPETLVIEVDGDRAEAAFDGVLARESEGGFEPRWRFRARAELVRGDDGWEVTGSEHETLSGRLPW